MCNSNTHKHTHTHTQAQKHTRFLEEKTILVKCGLYMLHNFNVVSLDQQMYSDLQVENKENSMKIIRKSANDFF